MAETLVFLVRHAQSVWNASERWQGQADPPLSPTGHEQAKAVAGELADAQLELVLTSDLRRALETAQQVAALHGLEPVPDPRLRELDVGRWSGLTREEIGALEPELLERFAAGDPDARPDGGETRREIRQRVRSALSEITAEHAGRRIGIVTHLGVIRALLPGTELENAAWVAVRADELAAPES